jgi:hypothetical protein
MKQAMIDYTKNSKFDHFDTPDYAVEPLLKYINPMFALEGVCRGAMYRDMGRKFGVLVLDRRVEFTGGSVWFNTSWFCYGILPRQLVFAELRK